MPLQDLPIEICCAILEDVAYGDLKALRLTCKHLEYQATRSMFKNITVCLQVPSLER